MQSWIRFQKNSIMNQIEEGLKGVNLADEDDADNAHIDSFIAQQDLDVNVNDRRQMVSHFESSQIVGDVGTDAGSVAQSLSKYFQDDSANRSFEVTCDASAKNFFENVAAPSIMNSLHEAIDTSSDECDRKMPANVSSSIFPHQIPTKPLLSDDSEKEFGDGITELQLEGDVNSEDLSPPSLSRFFSNEKTGDDRVGKAFFDSITRADLSQHCLEISAISDSSASSLPASSCVARPYPIAPSLSLNDDPFSASLQASESDRRHDAWIPSSNTRQTLVALATSVPGTFFPERDQMTMPGIVLEEDLVDPVHELIVGHVGQEAANKRVTLTADSVTQDEDGLKRLIEACCHRSAINLTGRLLALCGHGVGRTGFPTKLTPQIIQIWYARIALLVKIQQFDIAQVEASAFGDMDKPDLYFEFYPELFGARKGCMIPFAFRLLVAELPRHLGQFAEALDRLRVFLATVRKILNNLENGFAEDGSMVTLSDANRTASRELWESRELKVLHSTLNCLILQKDYPSAVDTVFTIMKKDPSRKKVLWNLLGRIYLHLGDIQAAEDSFSKSSELKSMNVEDSIRDSMSSGFIEIAHNRYDGALEKFNKVLEMDPNNPVAMNNVAVCLVYLGRLREALKLLEGGLRQQPEQFLHEGVVFNICTLYELESSRSHQRKTDLLQLVAAHHGDGFNAACLKHPLPKKDVDTEEM